MNINDTILNYLDQNNISDIKDLISILDYSFDGIVLTNRQGQIFYVNQALERLFGIERMYFIGKKPSEFKKDGLILKVEKKTSDDNITHIIQIAKDGRMFLITSVPVLFKKEMFYYANYREVHELNNLQMELLEESTKITEFDFAEELKELINIFSSNKIIIKSLAMVKIIRIVKKIANTDIIVNISGESGVGKDVIAKLIHSLSSRKQHPFVQINCGSIPENLLESELFGYSEGSFTGANKKGRIGLLEMANNGTVFLDEIGDLPFNLQVKLLKVLQDQEIYKIGGRTSIKLNLRIICATNQNLEKMVMGGKFRADLYFRINTMPIRIPPLRERKEDIIHLSKFFINKYNEKYHRNKVLSTDVCNIMEVYNWPGNVRELKSLIERLVITSEGDKINVADLPQMTVNQKQLSKKNIYNISNLKAMVRDIERDIIAQAITKYGSRQAAEILGIDYSTLKRKKREYRCS